MTDWQERVYHELHDLNARRDRLSRFIGQGEYDLMDDEGKQLLDEQLEVMRKYADILMRRIARFRR